MIICSKCKDEKSIDDFSFKDKKAGVRHPHCKECQKAYRRKHYELNKPKYLAKARKNAKSARLRLQEKMFDYLLSHPCIDCGEADPVVLEFDHRNKEEKSFAVCRKMYTGASWELLLSEIDKCDVRCSNCHKRRHAKEDGHYKYTMAQK